MSLSLKSRRVGEIGVVTCAGRIVEGDETATLQRHLTEVLARDPHIVLDLGGIDFIDSSGLGLIVRFLNRCRAANGGLKLSAVPPRITEVLRITNLAPIFDAYPSEAEAVAAFYRPAASAAATFPFRTQILCVESSTNLLAGIRELLGQAGYGAMSADNLPDALILLQATRPSLVVISAALRAMTSTSTGERFNRRLDTLTVIELPADFSSQDAGEAGRRLIEAVRAAIGEPDSAA